METSYFLRKGYVEGTHSSKIQTSVYFIFLVLVFHFSLLTKLYCKQILKQKALEHKIHIMHNASLETAIIFYLTK
jgi:hypothetical protein